MKIYTRGGDAGQTSLFDGTRVSKADPRVDAYGDIDELNAVLGLARSARLDAALDARLADPGMRVAGRAEKASLGADDIARLERWIDEADAELTPLRRFILPGGVAAAAALHLARTVCRRAERHIVGLGESAVEPELIAYVNRLSDLLFVLARVANARAGAPDVEW